MQVKIVRPCCIAGVSHSTIDEVVEVAEPQCWALLASGRAVLATVPPGSPAKVYRALLTQAGTAAPVATVLENTLGAVVWTRETQGAYRATLSGAFTANKTLMFAGADFQVNASWSQAIMSWTSADSFSLVTLSVDITGPNGDLSDGLLSNTSITILVYP